MTFAVLTTFDWMTCFAATFDLMTFNVETAFEEMTLSAATTFDWMAILLLQLLMKKTFKVDTALNAITLSAATTFAWMTIIVSTFD